MTMPEEDEIRSAVRSLLDFGWQVRPNPIVHTVRAVQLSLVYSFEGERYVDIVTLSYHAPSLVLHCIASYDPDFPFDHNVVWERFLTAAEALNYAQDLNTILGRPAEPERVEPAHTRQHPDEAERGAPEWFFTGRGT